MREQKRTDGPELRTLGGLSLVRQLLTAGLVDRLKLAVCPLSLQQTGVEPAFEGLPDMGFDLLSNRVLDGRVLLLEYRPAAAPTHYDASSQIGGVPTTGEPLYFSFMAYKLVVRSFKPPDSQPI